MPPVSLNVSGLSIDSHGAGQSEVYARDTFSDTAGTALSSHAGTPGGGSWSSSSLSGVMAITNAGRVRQDSTTSGAWVFSVAPPTADYTVSATLHVATIISLEKGTGVLARFDGSGNGYVAYYNCQTDIWYVSKAASGVLTQLGSSTALTPSPGSDYAVVFRLVGSSLQLDVNGSTLVSVTDSTYGSAGKAGIYVGACTLSYPSDTTGVHIDDFAVGVSSLEFLVIANIASLSSSASAGATNETIRSNLSGLLSSATRGVLGASVATSLVGLQSTGSAGGVTPSVRILCAGIGVSDSVGGLSSTAGSGVSVNLAGLSVSGTAGGKTASTIAGLAGLTASAWFGGYSTGVGGAIVIGLSGLSVTDAAGGDTALVRFDAAGILIADLVGTLTFSIASGIAIDLSGLEIGDGAAASVFTAEIGLPGLAIADVFLGSLPIRYHVYANSGIADPIDYDVPLISTELLAWTSDALAYPGTWKFGVRAFTPDDNLEERNIDAVVEIQLDANGVDITRIPDAPLTLSAHAAKSAAVVLNWQYQLRSPLKRPVGFRIYRGVGTPNYTTPVDTVPFTFGIVLFSHTITGQTNGTAYVFAVRAYNDSGEESNTITASVTADSSGPEAVSGLTGVAVP